MTTNTILYQKIISFRYTSPTAHREDRRVFVYKEDDGYISAYDLDDEEFRKFLKEFMEDIEVHGGIQRIEVSNDGYITMTEKKTIGEIYTDEKFTLYEGITLSIEELETIKNSLKKWS